MTREEWVKDKIGKQPVFDSKDKAVQAAIQANKDGQTREVWEEPQNRGGRFVAAEPSAFETLYREGYKRVYGHSEIVDMFRGDHIDKIKEV